MRAELTEFMAVRHTTRRGSSAETRRSAEVLARGRFDPMPPARGKPAPPSVAPPHAAELHKLDWVLGLLAVGTAYWWAFWPTIETLVDEWRRHADYSHGFLVPPVALLILWLRRDRRPRNVQPPGWMGLALIAFSSLLAIIGGRYFLSPLAGWSMVFWIGGTCLVLGGGRTFLWASPAIVFLFFMVPLPYRTEQWFSAPLQSATTALSSWMLQALGFPAVAAGNTVYLGEVQLEVEHACSGLRTLVGIAALVYVLVVVTGRPLWVRAVLILSAVPVALAANALRVVATGMAYQWFSGELAQRFSHDVAGWLAIPTAAALLGGVLWFLGRLFVEVEPVAGPELLDHSKSVANEG